MPWVLPVEYDHGAEGASTGGTSDNSNNNSNLKNSNSNNNNNNNATSANTGSNDASAEESSRAPKGKTTTVDRYCHVFVKGELEALIATMTNVEIVESYYDASNHACVFRKKAL